MVVPNAGIKTISDLKVSDKVRIKIAGKFTKSSEPQFSDQVYEVKTISKRRCRTI